MKFPLAHAPFGPLRLGEGDRKEAVELADVFVQQTLADYETHLEVQHGVVDEVRWKMVKRFEDVVVYQDRETMRPRRLTLASSSSGSGYEHRESPNEMQKLLWFGTVQGSLDEIMYGVANPTAEEAKSEGVVETYVKAFFDVMGDMPSSIATFVSAKGVVSVWKLGDYAEMKKLMWLLKQHNTVPSYQDSSSNCCRVCHKDVRGVLSRRQACCICSGCACSRCSIPKKLHHMSPLTRTVMQTSVVVCTPCMRTVLTTSCLEAAQAEAERNNHAGGSIKDTSSPSSSASSHAW
ncbi:hypothetical protein PC119_g22571 [Phytophthora cactorum]|nr:hypothetical protein PC119_g22571 [Phytophthora cactorum]